MNPRRLSNEAKDEKAAARANTPEGKLTYCFAKTGELQKLAKCQGKWWKIEKENVCSPYGNGNEGM